MLRTHPDDPLVDDLPQLRSYLCAAKLVVRAWERRRPGKYTPEIWCDVETDGVSIIAGHECLVTRIPGALVTVLSARPYRRRDIRWISHFIASELNERQIPVVTVVPPAPCPSNFAEQLNFAWETHLERSAPDYDATVKGFARKMVKAWLADEDFNFVHAYVEYSTYAGDINVQFDCILTRGESPSIALISAKRFPRGGETQVFRDAVRDYLAQLRIPFRELRIVKERGYVTRRDLREAWAEQRPAIVKNEKSAS